MFAKLKSLSKKTTTAGTAVALVASKTIAHGAKIKAPSTNTGKVYVGASGVTSVTGFELAAGESLDLADLLPLGYKDVGTDLNLVYVDSAVNAEGVCVSYLELAQG